MTYSCYPMLNLVIFCNINFLNRRNKMANENKMMTPNFRVSYPSVLKPQAKKKPDDRDKYSISMIFNKQYLKDNPDEMARFKAMVAEAARVRKSAFGDEEVKRGNPMKDADKDPKKKDDEYYKGSYFCEATTTYAPECFDRNKEDLLSEKEFYPGCYARARVHAYEWDNNGGGVSFGFDAVQKMEDGELIGDGGSAKDDFDDCGDAPASAADEELDDILL